MAIKKVITICLSALIALTFTGCSFIGSSVDELISAPKLEGDMHPVQNALEDYAGNEISLKYPVTGEYRTAFVLKDLNGDGKDEAIAFYSTTVNSAVTMHLNIIAQNGDRWQSRGDLSVVGTGVESISFSDLDGDGTQEAIVGWMIYGSTEKQLGIYTFDGNTLVQRALEPYTTFVCADLTGDKINDLSVIYLNTAASTATAKLFSLSSDGIIAQGTANLDGGVSSYSIPAVSTLKGGIAAIYIDAVKGNGMLTEIIWYKDGALHSLNQNSSQEEGATYRNSSVASRDYDGNGVIDIPVSELLISTAEFSDSDKAYYTNWCEFDGEKLHLQASTFMNYSDGYSITVPEKWKQKLLLIRKTEARMRFFYSYNPATKESGKEMFRIVAATVPDYIAGAYSAQEYIMLDRTDNLIYLAKIIPENALGITEKDAREMFSIIK
jgi:hypothetical protein